MPFCKNCGAALADPVRFCPQCGREVSAGETGQAQVEQGTTATAELSHNVAGLLCYVAWFITGILFLILAPYSRQPFVRFHAFQSILASAALFVAWMIISVFALIPVAGPYLSAALFSLYGLATFVLWLVLMVQAYQGKKWKLPVIGDLAERQSRQ
jgi:uncharacterized membrane protein